MAALDYAGSAALMADQAFRDRIKVASLHYAQYIIGESPSVTAHNTRYRWAQNTMVAPDTTVAQITPAVVMQDSVQQQGAAITDADLQTAVETTVNQLM
jgi:hypothetical protein